MHVVVMTVGRNHLILIAIGDKYLPAASLQRMQVRRVGSDILRELFSQIALLDEKLILTDRSPIEDWVLVYPIAIDSLAESAWCADAGRRTTLPTNPHLGAIRIARTIP